MISTEGSNHTRHPMSGFQSADCAPARRYSNAITYLPSSPRRKEARVSAATRFLRWHLTITYLLYLRTRVHLQPRASRFTLQVIRELLFSIQFGLIQFGLIQFGFRNRFRSGHRNENLCSKEFKASFESGSPIQIRRSRERERERERERDCRQRFSI